MRNVLILSVLLFSGFAAATDPFDPTSCSGPIMSGTRALELLGESSRVVLSIGEPDSIVKGQARRRQKIQGAVGPWYPVALPTEIIPELFNNGGRLGLSLKIRASSTNSYVDYYCERKSDAFACGNGHNSSLELTAVLRDNCLRVFKSYIYANTDYEEVFLLNF